MTDNLNALRVRPATTATQRCDEFHVRIDPEARFGRHADYFGTEVIEFGISRAHELADDRRARARRQPPAPAPPEAPGRRWSSAAYLDARRIEYLLADRARPADRRAR